MDIFDKVKQRCKPFKNQNKIVNIVTITPEGVKSSYILIKKQSSIDILKG